MARSRGVGAPLVVLSLLVGGAVLGVLVVRWVNQASIAEEQRARASLALGAARVRMEAEEELRVIAALMRPNARDLESQDWTALADAALFWYTSARHPEVVRSIRVARASSPSAAWVYDAGLGAFRSDHSPTFLMTDEGDPQGETIIRIPVVSEGGSEQDIVGTVSVVLDTGALYRRVIPDLMAAHLPGYPFRVIADGLVTHDAAQDVGSRVPEVQIGLDALVSFGGRLPVETRRAPGDRAGNSRPYFEDPSLRFWMLSGRLGREGPPGDEPGLRARLEIFYPDRSLESIILGRRVASIAVGVGLLALLTASAAVLTGLYRRSARLRASEQEFVASLSHELRTPIAVIQATAENIAESVVSDPTRLARYGKVMHEQVRRLSDMVEGVLFYSGLQADANHRPNMSQVDAAALIEQITQPLSVLAHDRGSRLAVRTEGLPRLIRTDPVALRLVVENLLTNAIRHADPGEIRMAITSRPYDLVRIEVEDDGPGIPAREQRRVFEPFVRGERSSRGQRPGSGLGLHLVRRVVAMLGGSVTLESPYRTLSGQTRAGCRFTVTVACPEGTDAD